MVSKCSKCGSTKIDDGYLYTASMGKFGVKYFTNHIKGLFKIAAKKIDAYACTECGYIELSVDPSELKKIIDTQ